jgi:hypothetical protein
MALSAGRWALKYPGEIIKAMRVSIFDLWKDEYLVTYEIMQENSVQLRSTSSLPGVRSHLE